MKLKKHFGLKQVPLGSQGRVIGYFGSTNQPLIEFENQPGYQYFVDPKKLKVIKGIPPEKPKIYYKTNEYYDDGQGHQFYYDVEIPEFETPEYQTRIDGYTEKQVEKKLSELTEDDDDWSYFNALSNLFQYWSNESIEDLKTQGFAPE